MRVNSLLRSTLLTLPLWICGQSALAQNATLTLPAGTGDDPRSVSIVSNSSYLAIVNQVDGWLHMVKITNPLAPTLVTSWNPPAGDVWFEAEYTPSFGGRLFTGHRGGGLNMIDLSNPAAPSSAAFASTIYHFRGLRYRQVGPGGALFYNETNSGLNVFAVNNTGTTLTSMWNDYATNNDGNGMELVNDVLYQMGTPPNNLTDRLYRGFDIGNPFAPIMTMNNTVPNQVGTGAHQLLRKSPTLPYLLVARWNDGLELHNASIPNAPVVTQLLPALPGLRVWGVAWLGAPFAVAYGSLTVNNVNYYWWYILQVFPGPIVVPVTAIQVPMDTHDMAFDPNTNRIYAVGRQNGNGQGLLWVF